ncbi:hypothetical protein K1719_019608 [Acacia pycnantha]|nr:hypothetical protein K1719_019608 [Acacia pycnantha]
MGSGFEFIFEIGCKITHTKSLILALINAYETHTGAFRIGQNELSFGLEDVLMITGLPIDGKPVIFEGNTPNLTNQQVLELVGVGSKDNYVSTNELATFINSFEEACAGEDMINCTARAAALLGIACMIYSNLGKSRIHIKFLHFLKDVGEIRSYTWGAASWIFFLTRISKLVSVCFKKMDRLIRPTSFPLFTPFVSALSDASFFNGKHRPSVEQLEKILFELNPSEVVWQPYHDLVLDDPYLQQGELRRSWTTAVFLDHAVHHLPQKLIAELNEILANETMDEDGLWKKKLTDQSLKLFEFLPRSIQEQLMLERDPHGNVQVAKIEIEDAHSDG